MPVERFCAYDRPRAEIHIPLITSKMANFVHRPPARSQNQIEADFESQYSILLGREYGLVILVLGRAAEQANWPAQELTRLLGVRITLSQRIHLNLKSAPLG